MQDGNAIFRRYLRSLSNELLESVSEDYIWLAGLDFPDEKGRDADFRRRREHCREECLRRGVPELFHEAGGTDSSRAA